MSLSEYEQRAFEQLEQALYRDDPLFAHRVGRANNLLNDRRNLWLSVGGLAVGLGLMFVFCLTTAVVVGVAGFLFMLASLNALCWRTRFVIESKVAGMSLPGRRTVRPTPE